MSKDTPGAIEAAEIISDLVSDRRADWCVGDLAEIIDRETAAPQLLAACEARLAEWHSNARNMERDEPASVRLARAAIAKARS